VPVPGNDVPGTKVNASRGLLGFVDPWRVRRNSIRGRYA